MGRLDHSPTTVEKLGEAVLQAMLLKPTTQFWSVDRRTATPWPPTPRSCVPRLALPAHNSLPAALSPHR